MINKRYESLDCLKGVACLAVGKCLDLLAEKNHLWQYTAFKYSKLFLIIILTLILSYIIHQGYVSFNKWHTCKKDVYHV